MSNIQFILQKLKQKCSDNVFGEIITDIKQLNEDQRAALVTSINILYNTRDSVCISGPAGTGKTFLTKVLLKILESLYDSSKIALSAPTHQAKKVLANSSGRDAFTVHSLFRILPNLEEDRTEFTQRGDDLPKLQDILFLVIDEVSMIDEKLFKIIYEKLPMNTRIIALGDPYQLAPVNSESISLFFTHKDFTQIKLTKIMRQSSGSPIIEQGDNIRRRVQNNLVTSNDGKTGIFGFNTEREFLDKYLSIVKSADDAINNRIIAYTNNKVNELNNIIRKVIYKTDDQIVKGELLVLQQAVMNDNESVFDNGEILKVLNIKEKHQYFFFPESKDEIKVKYYNIEVLSLDTSCSHFINIISDEDIGDFNFKMHCEASQLKLRKKKQPYIRLGQEWKEWWANKNFFVETKPIFASTVHKAQGVSLDNCFVYQNDFDKARLVDNYYQLLYVAVTRAKNNIYFV